ncbi:MAG: hypothetical protein HW416_3583 [Chloroflexi bacterium]|nr:hypothetical protein [Chloroflexota bacterium]
MKAPYSVVVLAIPLVLGCTAPGPDRASPNLQAQAGRGATVEKSVTIAQLNAVKTYTSWDFSNTTGGGAALVEVHTEGLVSGDGDGNPTPRLALWIPSLEDQTISIQPDGRMRTTWALRPAVTWQDGAPLTAADVAFTWRVARDPDIPVAGAPAALIQQIDSVAVEDPLTVTIIWKTTFYQAVELGVRNLWLLPSHLLATAFEGDKQAFLALPYFTSEYVHLGPFRLVDFGLGEHQVFERFDGYFRGRPKLDRVILRSIADPNIVLTNVRAGAVDVAAEKTLPTDVAVTLRDEWVRNSGGTVVGRQDAWPFIQFQFDPALAQASEIGRDLRIRRGLLLAIDRDALRNLALPGFLDTSADTFVLKRDPRATRPRRCRDRRLLAPTRARRRGAGSTPKGQPESRMAGDVPRSIHVGARYRGDHLRSAGRARARSSAKPVAREERQPLRQSGVGPTARSFRPHTRPPGARRNPEADRRDRRHRPTHLAGLLSYDFRGGQERRAWPHGGLSRDSRAVHRSRPHVEKRLYVGPRSLGRGPGAPRVQH